MTEPVAKLSTEIQELSSILLSTLDESIFFNELSKFLLSVVECDQIMVFKVLDDLRAVEVSQNGVIVEDGLTLEKGAGVAGHVVRTKKAYFSNNVTRDPLFINLEDDIIAELCVPVVYDNLVIGTVHFQSFDDSRPFTREDIIAVNSILDQLSKPLANMKMYLSAKFLNEALMRQIEVKEQELQEKSAGVKLDTSFKIEDKEVNVRSQSMKEILTLTQKVASSEVNVLVHGENGAGKEMIARKIHCKSDRTENSFLILDCSALSREQMEEELFGIEAFNFGGEHGVKAGYIEKANGGSILIKNIDRMPLSTQSKLFMFINQNLAFRVGGQVPFRSNVRIIATTHRDLSEHVGSGDFREDLFYALNTVTIKVPALRERLDDIELLANDFMNKGKPFEKQKSLAPGALKALKEYSWPGNVRELQNVIERAYILSDGVIVESSHLAENVFNNELKNKEEEVSIESFEELTLDELERRHICRTLDHLGGNKTKTAKTLGITVKTLYNKLHSYGMIQVKEA